MSEEALHIDFSIGREDNERGGWLPRIIIWGETPSSFGAIAGDLLVGNFGDGRITAFDASTHAAVGQVLGADGKPLSIDGLWALSAGNDGSAGSSHLLYFTAGPDGETHGLLGVLTPVPEPSSLMLLVAGFGMLGVWNRRRNVA